MLSRVAVTSVLCFAASPPAVSGYPAIGGYMPVSSVLEHMQMTEEVKAFNEALTGDDPDYAMAKTIYQFGTGSSCKSPSAARTLQAFATADLTGESYYDAFIAAGWDKVWWDSWMLHMLDGTGVAAGFSRVKRVTCLKKGVLGLMTHYTSHELEDAIVMAQDPVSRGDKNSAHAWDEGWAFYYGNDPAGVDSAWEAAKKRDEDFPTGANISKVIVEHFNKGLIAVRKDTYDLTAAKAARDDIYRMWVVAYLRAALKYLELAEHRYDEKAHAEGYAYYLPIDGLVHAKSPAASQTMMKALDISKPSIAAGTYCAAKAAVEAAYTDLGISCDSVGVFKDAVITNCQACTGSAGPLPSGVGPVAAVSGTATDMTCVPTTTAPAEPITSGAHGRAAAALMPVVMACLASRA
eukprot:CAMPEP_0176039768 /NCGR_PEP_ID=MMETSP0120_2-20121206/19715_1 /TAXON_ID=160619 /ORGANISM="Kryptoperidinium foliaceum, Strain CCMP 1326" /LENGTH=406 /DNA_ID=CAMNT_0017373163 /DNA_START=74 /DNA_END=1294 /DNA_ORIENTATION=+